MPSLLGFTYKPPSPVDEPYFNEPSKGDVIKADIARRSKDRPTNWGNLFTSGAISALEGAKNLTPRNVLNAPYNAGTALLTGIYNSGQNFWGDVETAMKPSGALYKFPGMTGYSSVSPAQQKAITNTSLNLLGASGVPMPVKGAARPSQSTLGMNLGPGAVGADLNALAKAKKLKTMGKTRAQIRKETDWVYDPHDEQWKFMLSDIDAKIAALPASRQAIAPGEEIGPHTPSGELDEAGNWQFNQQHYLDEGLFHPGVFKAYPFLKDIKLNIVKDLLKVDKLGGYYKDRGSDQTIAINERLTTEIAGRMDYLKEHLGKGLGTYNDQMEFEALKRSFPYYQGRMPSSLLEGGGYNEQMVRAWAEQQLAERGDRFANDEQMAQAREVGYGEYFGEMYEQEVEYQDREIERAAMNSEEMRDTYLHEIQHAIQHAENFARGGSNAFYDWVHKYGKQKYKTKQELRTFDDMTRDVKNRLENLGIFVERGDGPANITNFRPKRKEVMAGEDLKSGDRDVSDNQIPALSDKLYLQLSFLPDREGFGLRTISEVQKELKAEKKMREGGTNEVSIEGLHQQLLENGASLDEANKLVQDLKAVYKLQNSFHKYFYPDGTRKPLTPIKNKTKRGKKVTLDKMTKHHIPTPLASPKERYYRLWGEAEARQTERLSRYSQEELKRIDPLWNLDINPDMATSIIGKTPTSWREPKATIGDRVFKGDVQNKPLKSEILDVELREGGTVEVTTMPSTNDIKKLLAKAMQSVRNRNPGFPVTSGEQTLRWNRDVETGKIFVWDSFDADHDQIAEKTNVPRSSRGFENAGWIFVDSSMPEGFRVGDNKGNTIEWNDLKSGTEVDN